MSQQAFVSGLGADIHAAMLDAGMADEGVFTPKAVPGDPPPVGVPCLLYVDRGVQIMGDYGRVIGRRTTVTLLVTGLPARESGATVTADGATFVLDVQTEQFGDDSLEQWVVTHG